MSDALQHPKRATKVSYKEPPLPRASLVIWIIGIGLLILLLWAGLFQLEEVSTGTGKVIPSSKEQVIQSLDGGILTKLDVQEGDIVEKGQVLAQLDPTRFESNVRVNLKKMMKHKFVMKNLSLSDHLLHA